MIAADKERLDLAARLRELAGLTGAPMMLARSQLEKDLLRAADLLAASGADQFRNFAMPELVMRDVINEHFKWDASQLNQPVRFMRASTLPDAWAVAEPVFYDEDAMEHVLAVTWFGTREDAVRYIAERAWAAVIGADEAPAVRQ